MRLGEMCGQESYKIRSPFFREERSEGCVWAKKEPEKAIFIIEKQGEKKSSRRRLSVWSKREKKLVKEVSEK